MVHIRGGHFDRRPVNDFCLDTHEVTVGEFAEYVATLEADAQRTKKELAEFKAALSTVSRAEEHAQYSENCTWRHRDKLQRHPMNCVTVRDAEAFCQARGKRLPTGREWQWAARDGKKAKKYPWGGQPPSLVRLHMATDPDDRYKRTQPVGQYEPTESGLYDLAGNVWEWTACAHTDPSCTSRGGGFRTHDEKFLRVAFENTGGLLTDRSDETGFRCAANIRRPPRAKQRGTAP